MAVKLVKNCDLHSLGPLQLHKFTKKELKEYFLNAYDLDELIFSAIKDERAFYLCPNYLRLPLIFYMGHTAAMYINKLLLAGLIRQHVNREFETLFETGVDEMSWDDTENYRMGGVYVWPNLSEVLEYRNQVMQVVIDVIDNSSIDIPVTQHSPWWSLVMAIEHERIHIETSSVLIRQLPIEFLQCPSVWRYAPTKSITPVGENELITVPSGEVQFGKPTEFPSYGWDCEYGEVSMSVPQFEASKYLVTNKEFLTFVQGGGYSDKNLWSSEGWMWLQFSKAKHPVFWVCDKECPSMCGGKLQSYSHCKLPHSLMHKEFCYRAIYDVIEMPWDWPVDVNYHEAKAFCKWKGSGYRLPTEAEHNRMRGEIAISSDVNCDPWLSGELQANVSFEYGSSSPVNLFQPSSLGFYDLYGNVFEWVEDHMNGLPGFEVSYLYNDFIIPFTSGKHNINLGGSWASSGTIPSRFNRTWMRRHFFQHMGFRLVKSFNTAPVRLCRNEIFILEDQKNEESPVLLDNVDLNHSVHPSCNIQFKYETKLELERQLQSYKSNWKDDLLANYCRTVVLKYGSKSNSILHTGCGAGYLSFILSNSFTKVVGLDYSELMISAAKKLKSRETINCNNSKIHIEKNSNPDRVQFLQLTWLPNELKDFDVILIELLDRAQSPKSWLIKLWECVKSDGIVIISGSHLWDKDTLYNEIGKWFKFQESKVTVDNLITVWRLEI